MRACFFQPGSHFGSVFLSLVDILAVVSYCLFFLLSTSTVAFNATCFVKGALSFGMKGRKGVITSLFTALIVSVGVCQRPRNTACKACYSGDVGIDE